MKTLRGINLGLPKTGTTTLTDALRHAGLTVADWRIRSGETAHQDLVGQFVGKMIYTDYYDSGDPLARLGEFDFINEMSCVRHDHSLWPQTDWGVISAIRRHHPQVKFLLSHRDPAKTANSMMRWNNLGKTRLPRADVPGLPRGFGTTEAELARWLEGHFAFVRQVFQGCDSFLEFDIEDGDARDRIADFLGIDLPWWGQSNTGKPMKLESN
tara:strand:- start:53458 stop:54093 length:636 start_codon:yes stop_codon:yes gene_type:complete